MHDDPDSRPIPPHNLTAEEWQARRTTTPVALSERIRQEVEQEQRDRAARRAHTDAQIAASGPAQLWSAAFGSSVLHSHDIPRSTREALLAGQPVNPYEPGAFNQRDSIADWTFARFEHLHATKLQLRSHELTDEAISTVICAQRDRDTLAQLPWNDPDPDLTDITDRLRAATPHPGHDLDHRAYSDLYHRRRALARALQLSDREITSVSRWLTEQPLADADLQDPRSWRLGSPRWQQTVADQLPYPERVERPVGVFLAPHGRNGWALLPCVSIELMRLAHQLGGTVSENIAEVRIPRSRTDELLARININVLTAGYLSREDLDDTAKQARQLSDLLGRQIVLTAPALPIERWGRLSLRYTYLDPNDYASDKRDAIALTISTIAHKRLPARRFGSAGRDGLRQASVAMDMGEAIDRATSVGLPIVLSSEASGMAGTVRVGRMRGQPGRLTITAISGFEATTTTHYVEQAVGRLRTLAATSGAKVSADAAAAQTLRMFNARPLEGDEILFEPQQAAAAAMIQGSCLQASDTGCGKTVMSGRSLHHLVAAHRRFRGLLVCADGLLGQWREELSIGAPGRSMPPLCPDARVEILDGTRPLDGQLRRWHREAGDQALLVLCGEGTLDAHPRTLAARPWHLLLADEALRYVNPATVAHQALKQVRFAAVDQCWLLTATPKGKNVNGLDILMGLALGDESLLREQLATKEAGDLTDQTVAHRLRLGYGPHFQRVTSQQMNRYLPKAMPAKAIAVDPDPATQECLELVREGGRDAYRQLLRALKALRACDQVDKAAYKAALAEVSRAQATVLSNVAAFVDVSVDPLITQHSEAAIAVALRDHHVFQEAMVAGGQGMPLLRSYIARAIRDAVHADRQVLVFAQRIWGLRGLADSLRTVMGIDARVITGQNTAEEIDQLKAAFQAREYPVCLLSPVGERGHNLQSASQMVHLDLPWTEGQLQQRIGRAVRPGSLHDRVYTATPYLKGGGIPHVVGILAPRAAAHHQLLDSYDGIRAEDSALATQLVEITAQVADQAQASGRTATSARMRVAAAIFGD